MKKIIAFGLFIFAQYSHATVFNCVHPREKKQVLIETKGDEVFLKLFDVLTQTTNEDHGFLQSHSNGRAFYLLDQSPEQLMIPASAISSPSRRTHVAIGNVLLNCIRAT